MPLLQFGNAFFELKLLFVDQWRHRVRRLLRALALDARQVMRPFLSLALQLQSPCCGQYLCAPKRSLLEERDEPIFNCLLKFDEELLVVKVRPSCLIS